MNERPRFGRVWNFLAVSFVVVLVACTTVQVGLTPGDVMLAFAPDGSMVATAPTGDNTILLLESRTLAKRGKLSGKSVTGKTATSVHSLEFSRDGTRLLAAGIGWHQKTIIRTLARSFPQNTLRNCVSTQPRSEPPADTFHLH
jgi:hypothetical protein